MDRLQPGWRHEVVTSRFLPQITVNQRLPLAGDPPLHRLETDIPNLFIAGDWAAPDVILSEAAVTTGKLAALEIIEKW